MNIVLIAFIACAGLQLLYYLFVFSRVNFIRRFKSLPENLPPVSVVICVKDDARNLQQYLKIVLIQQYPQFEVVVVNDQSTDNTIDVLVEYYKRNKNLKVVNIPAGEAKPYAGKKYALTKGIEIATYDYIVVTDADCRPATTHWLAKMVGAYMPATKVVLGHSPYEKHKGFLNKVIRYENLMTALQYLGFAKAGMPYMGVGRNLSYKKELFRSFKGFEKNKDVLTGDDDLFINAVATANSTEICIDKDAFMYTEPVRTFSQWLNQKKRHLRSGFKYRFHHQALLFLFAVSNFFFYVTFIILLAGKVGIPYILITFASIILLKPLITFNAYRKLGVGDLLLPAPILDIIYAGYLLIIFLLLLLKRKDHWRI